MSGPGLRLLALDPAELDPAHPFALPAGLVPGRGWPHDDTADAVRLASPQMGGRVWLVVLAEPDPARVIGECGTVGPVRPDGSVEIGYGLAAPWRGRGLGTAAVAALVALLRVDPDVRRILARVHVGNPASGRVLAGQGFEPGTDRDESGHITWTLAALSPV